MFCAGRYKSGNSLGKDLTIGDLCSNMPVGLFPDFVHEAHDRSSEEFMSRVSALNN
jgi:hypothetical protein